MKLNCKLHKQCNKSKHKLPSVTFTLYPFALGNGKCILFHSMSLSPSVAVGEMISFKIAYFIVKISLRVQIEQKLSSY